jgi:hypothetical protein
VLVAIQFYHHGVSPEDAKASIPNLTMINAPNLHPITFTLRRKAATRTEAWYNNVASPPPPPLLRIPGRTSRAKSTEQIQLPYYPASPSLQDENDDEVKPATKKPRIETPIATATAEAATKTASIDVAMALPPADSDDDANTDDVTPSNILALLYGPRYDQAHNRTHLEEANRYLPV